MAIGSYAKINQYLGSEGLTGTPDLMGSSLSSLSDWMNYDPSANSVTGTGSITGSGMGAILDALARNSYQNVEGAINKQANVGREAAFDELSRRGIVTSSEAPAAMSVLEGQRLDQIRNAAQDIEGQRLQGQMSIPGMLMGIGSYGANEQQRGIQNVFSKYGLRLNDKQLKAQKDAMAQGGGNAAAYGQLGSSLGSMLGYAVGGPLGGMAGSSAGGWLSNLFGGGGGTFEAGGGIGANPTIDQPLGATPTGYYDENGVWVAS